MNNKIAMVLILVGIILSCKDKHLDRLVQKDTVFWNAIKKKVAKQQYVSSYSDLPREKLDSLLNHYALGIYLKRESIAKNNDTLYFMCYERAPNLIGNIYFKDALKIYDINEDSSSFKIERARIQHGKLGELLREKNN